MRTAAEVAEIGKRAAAARAEVAEAMEWLQDEAARYALFVPCKHPACSAPAGECCRTGGGTPRPAHVDRLKAGQAYHASRGKVVSARVFKERAAGQGELFA